jgi:serine/threonine protein kinase
MNVPGSSSDHEISESLSRLCNAACDRFEAAWKAVASGKPRPLLEQFLPDISDLERKVILRELILLDAYYRRSAGETCTVADYLLLFPGLDPGWLAEALKTGAAGKPVLSTAAGTGSAGSGSVADFPTLDPRSYPPAGPPPSQRYTREHLHARGGIGQVWVARDLSIGRQVALKELRPDRAGKADLRARFLTEARVTGQLEHPGIVPVYEVAWNPEEGEPFYTMRLVKGRTLRETAADYHCKRQQGQARALDLRGLLDVFVSVCNVVAYTHSRGVLHRDLKGQNVVLGDYGEVFLLDWGLAKVVGTSEQPLGALGTAPRDLMKAPAAECATLASTDAPAKEEEGLRQLTVEGQVLGTPGYMAPEQAAGQPERIDERTDVYGLGAILYEILTGQAPFSGPDVRTVLTRVQHDAPAPPHAMNRTVDAALEAICLKALHKLPQERFASAQELAQEVRRFLAGEPVSCYPDPWTVRLRRWMGRHRTLVTGTAAAGVVAVLCLAVATLLLKTANDRERASRLEAEDTLRLAQQIVDSYLVQVSNDPRLKGLGMEKLRRDFLLQAKDIYEQFVRREGGTSGLQLQRAQALHGLGLIETEIGERGNGRQLYEEALAVVQGRALDRATGPGREDLQARVARDLAVWHDEAQHPEMARAYFDQALEIHRRLAADPDAPPASHYQLALTLHQFGRFHVFVAGSPGEGKALIELAMRELRPLTDVEDPMPEHQSTLARCYMDLSSAYRRLGQEQEIEPMLQACLKVLKRLNALHPDVPVYQHDYGNVLMALATQQALSPVAEQAKRAAASFREALPVFERLAYYHPDVPLYAEKCAIIWLQLARQSLARNELVEAKEALDKGQALLENFAKESRGNADYPQLLIQLRPLEGAWHAQMGNHVRAAQILDKQRAELAQGHYPKYLRGMVSYSIACYYCRAAEAARADPKLAPAARAAACDHYLTFAVKTFQEAHHAGCYEKTLLVPSFKTDKDLMLLQPRPDFQNWLKGLEAEVAASSR